MKRAVFVRPSFRPSVRIYWRTVRQIFVKLDPIGFYRKLAACLTFSFMLSDFDDHFTYIFARMFVGSCSEHAYCINMEFWNTSHTAISVKMETGMAATALQSSIIGTEHRL